jgi:uronate dehydrogenase
MKLILMTGAAGGVARMLRPLMRADYRLRLSDVAPIPDRAADEEAAPADLADFQAVLGAVDGADAVVHLGGYSVEGPWEDILDANIVGAYHVFEAARQRGVKRIVFASSNHAVGFYRRDRTIGAEAPPRPDSRYGVSKAFGEALGSLYAFKYGLEVMSIRIGNVDEKPRDVRRLSIWISPRDLYQLVRIGLERPGIRHEIVYGMSDNRRAWWDNAAARRLGYAPQDRSEDFAAEVLAAHPATSGDAAADDHQGGPFCSAEAGGDPAKAGAAGGRAGSA